MQELEAAIEEKNQQVIRLEGALKQDNSPMIARLQGDLERFRRELKEKTSQCNSLEELREEVTAHCFCQFLARIVAQRESISKRQTE